MSLPIFQSPGDQPLMLLQTQWATQINPLLNNPASSPSLIKNINLTTGTNIINHKLGVVQQGWYICDINAPATIYRSAPFNNLTLTLYASAPCTITLGVF